jgi:ferredoxin-nitrate reductase
MVNRAEERWERTYCPYCGVGCGLLVGVNDEGIFKVKGDPRHPANFGDICAKAVFLPGTLRSSDRLLFPQVRAGRDEPFTRVTWDLALKTIAKQFREVIDEHGPEAVAFYGSGQLLTEDYYVGNKLAKGFLRTNNFDTNSRLCMASAVVGYKTSLGSDGPPAAYADFEFCDSFFLIGTNTAECHPIIFKRIEQRKRSDPERVRIIVVDPRRTETADLADLHLPTRPGTDIALLNGILHVLLTEGLVDRTFIDNHTKGFQAVEAIVAEYSPEVAADICGIPPSLLIQAAFIFGRAGGAITLWSMGVNQSTVGVQKNNAIHNLHLATGKIGTPGSGPFSLTGQPNAMGGRETGGLSHLLPGYRNIIDPAHREIAARAWGIPADHISPKPGLSALDMFEALARGEIKAVWILCTNPAASVPDGDFIERALRQAELVVVQDAYHPTGTTQFAHVLLPAAQWPEKEGVMTNSERRITYLPKIIDPPGEALPDWQILTLFAREMGWKDSFPYESAEEIFREFAALTEGTLCNCSGVSYGRLKKGGPLQWPCPSPVHPGTPRLYTDFHFPTPDGRANFIPVEHQDPLESPDEAYPLVLTTGRVKNQWHTMTRTGKVEALLKACREPFLEISPLDAKRWRILDGDFVEVTSRRGKAVVHARVTEGIRAGTCFMPFHWGRQYGFYKAANNLTITARDPVSRQPELKACAVRVKKVLDFPRRDT